MRENMRMDREGVAGGGGVGGYGGADGREVRRRYVWRRGTGADHRHLMGLIDARHDFHCNRRCSESIYVRYR